MEGDREALVNGVEPAQRGSGSPPAPVSDTQRDAGVRCAHQALADQDGVDADALELVELVADGGSPTR